jgi:hypothetical protein
MVKAGDIMAVHKVQENEPVLLAGRSNWLNGLPAWVDVNADKG